MIRINNERSFLFDKEGQICTYYIWGDLMNKKEQQKQEEQRNHNKYNSVTQKTRPENQNQTHNVRSEAVEPKIRQV